MGFTTLRLCTVGYSTLRLCTVGFSTLRLCTVGYSTLRLCTVGFTTLRLCTVGFSTLRLCTVMWEIPDTPSLLDGHIYTRYVELQLLGDRETELEEEARRKRRTSDDGYVLSVTHGTLPVEKFDQPFLLNTTLREISDTIKRVSVTLDVETAHPLLEVSEDRKSVRRTGTRRDLPDTGKRFTVGACVLGSEGFTSGRHYWEVEVTGNRLWYLGVAAESVERKRLFTLSPETGFWIIERINDEMWVHTSPESRLPAGSIPGRVGVYLSYQSGTVSFYNAETKSHLHTFTGNKFTGKLYPFFVTGNVNEWLRICSGSAPGL
ncbi:butyrophilin subfamily 1 member A1-like [Mobula birostris]|uniref:butyrophilin subfamily 1 member A1-like n=1 Tax=Mobula birostris TaxID=1983395 RepID=UPI003B280A8D